MIELVLLDFDGTLCVTHEAIGHCLNATMAHFGHEVPSEGSVMGTIRSGIGLAETFSILTGRPANETCEEYVVKYRALYNGGAGEERSRLFPGTREAMVELKSAGLKLVILSNKGEVAVRKALDQFALLDLCDLVVCETPGVAKKPDPAPYIKLVQPRFPEIPARNILVVGDTVADIRFAENISAFSCWASYGYGEVEKCSALEPDAAIGSMTELPALVRSWKNREEAA